jgi:hypothetical protein
MKMSRSNAPIGVRYNETLNVWFAQNPKFRDGIGKDERNDLMRCMENLEEIEAFLKTQNPGRARQLVHPTSVWRAYKRMLADKERREAAERAEKAAAESAKADDGTPLNVPILPPKLLSRIEVEAWGIAKDLRKTHGDEMARHIAKSLLKLLALED